MNRVTGVDLDLARSVLRTEAAAVAALADRIDDRFTRAVEILLTCAGRVIVTGMGKSGLIGRKIAATFSSTGTPAFFVHPAEAVHGDLGALMPEDVIVALSYNGETREILRLIEATRRLGARLVALTGEPEATLGQTADVALDCRVSEEACPMNLVPTASTTAMLAMGDALAMALLVAKGFRQEDFLTRHPGGGLGRRLMRAEHVMHQGERAPVVSVTTSMGDAIEEMTRKGLGMTCVVDDGGRLVGVITDGDLRRHMARHDGGLRQRTAAEVMSRQPATIARDTLATEALRVLEQRKITSVVVIDAARVVQGVVHLHDLWRTEMV